MKLIIFSLILVISACVPVIRQSYYLDLSDNKNLEIVEAGKPKNVKFADERAIKYRLSNELYSVNISLITKNNASFSLVAISNNNVELPIRSITPTPPPSKYCALLSKPIPQDKVTSMTKIFTLYLSGEKCTLSYILDKSYMTLVFFVLDDQENILGQETIRYKLIRNGLRVSSDSI